MTRTKEDDQVDASSVLVFYVNGKRVSYQFINYIINFGGYILTLIVITPSGCKFK